MFEIIGIIATGVFVLAVIGFCILWFFAKMMGMPD